MVMATTVENFHDKKYHRSAFEESCQKKLVQNP